MFTNTQIEEIRKKLLLKGIKDTQFPLADSLKGDETVAIVQQGINKLLGLKILLESVTKWSVSDFLNISKSSEDSYLIEEVLRLVTPINRKAGQVITFKDKRTGTWSIYQFKGKSAEDWFNLDYWDDILAKVDNHFKGLILNDCILNTEYPRPMVGDFAFVGSNLEEAVLYTCYNYGYWHNTEEPALDINDELKIIVEEIFNNVEKYPELVQLITSIAPIYNVDYNNYTADDFIKIKETIDKGGIITVSNVNVLGLTSYNVYNVASVSDYSIVLHTLVQNGMAGSSGGLGIKYTFNSVDITFIKTGNKSIIKKEFIYLLNGKGNKFLSDDGSYKEVPVSTSVHVLKYGTLNQQSFVELTDAINKNKIIILNNIPFSYFLENNIFTVSSISNNKIKLTSTKVVQTISAGDPNKANLDICIINVTINSDGTASYTYQDTFIHNVGDGTKFLADDGTYKSINITPLDFRTKIDITGVVMGISGQMNAETVTINKNIYNDLISNGGNTLFCYIYMDHTAFTQYNSANVPYCVGGDSDGMFICFNCMITSGFKTVKCRLTQTAITFDSVVS